MDNYRDHVTIRTMAQTPKILIVDDDPRICRLLSNFLHKEGYEVQTASCGDEMWELVSQDMPDLIILDFMLPGENGLTLAGKLRKQSDVGIIFLTGKNETIDKIVGLEVGADDYLAKPFDNRELLARIRSVYRRTHDQNETRETGFSPLIEFDGWQLDISANKLTSTGGEIVKLTDQETQLLSLLIKNAHKVLDREAILKSVTGHSWNPNSRSIDVAVGKLRKKINDSSNEPKYIKTIRNKGYMFIAKSRNN